MTISTGISNTAIAQVHAAQRQQYVNTHPQSQQLALQTQAHWLFGVPLHWMNDWSTPFPLFMQSAQGLTLTDVDGNEYVDFCLGDTGAMFGHSPNAVAAALATQAQQGLSSMLPTADVAAVGNMLSERFGLPVWQAAMSATDANRFALRWARAITGRSKLLVFNGCYHGTVDDVFVDLIDGVPQQRDSLLGQVYALTEHTEVIEFNDLAALEAVLQTETIACLLAEPVMTNVGMVLPQPDYWQQAQALCQRYGTLLILDETHTISTGLGGYATQHGLQADMLVLGKPLGGGMPCAVYGMSADIAARAQQAKEQAPAGHSGIGTTLTANALAFAAMRANLEQVMTPAAYAHMLPLAEQLAEGLRSLFAQHGVHWCVTQVGARVEFQFAATPPQNGTEARAIMLHELEQTIHLYCLNHGVLITPFHNMLLLSPATTAADVARLLAVLDGCLQELLG
ncbi:aspartate aminotransferase family protein [Vitreoscilla massiliensis]|uniref:Aspartate aminotransferase family protein n=1 Tax=Vitreoscilla massiliensis TaxID=1689272 RepID=A0ABY4E3V7_9NEIS|nr:aspartate aminotransferase family protein [Vitreoscilla massiliensis]UOO90461.1 aspartate aminotransferase family protein [Vitreoscilla massiliensis]